MCIEVWYIYDYPYMDYPVYSLSMHFIGALGILWSPIKSAVFLSVNIKQLKNCHSDFHDIRWFKYDRD
jgi:hypothetical protein